MAARYLMRFDDLCPTMDRAKWDRCESLMRRYGMKPIVAVIPENRFANLKIEEPDAGVWARMRGLQDDGWAIALHGFQHVSHAKARGLLGRRDDSEFTGLPVRVQRGKLEAGLAILRSHGLRPTVWVAPWHGFDATTVRILRSVGIEIISDGMSTYPYWRDGMFWIPQQLWAGKSCRRGVWTILVHANTQTDAEYERLAEFLEVHAKEFITVEEARREYVERERSFEDVFYRGVRLCRFKARRVLKRLR